MRLLRLRRSEFDRLLDAARTASAVEGFDRTLVSDEDWTALVAEFTESHEPIAAGRGDVMELSYVGSPPPMVTGPDGAGPGDWLI